MAALIFAPMMLLVAAAQPMPGMDHAPAACPATPAAVPPELAGWARQSPVQAGADGARATMLPIGGGVIATLLPASAVAYAVPPEKQGTAASSGGVFAFTAPATGRYRVALGAAAWIDVLSGTMPSVSVAHGHGPDCTGVRKTVDFDLVPGRYFLQVSGSGSAKLPLMVVRLP